MKKIGKAILFVIIASLVLFISYKLYFYYYAKNINEKVYINEDKDYVATITITDNMNNINTKVDYTKNENYLKKRRTDNNNYSNETFKDLKNKTEVTIYDSEKKQANMTIGFFGNNDAFGLLNYKFDEFYKSEKNILNKIKYFLFNIFEGAPTMIKTVEYEGRKCYALMYSYIGGFEEIYYIEKDTYLPVAHIDKTNMSKITYNIELKEVTDEEINYPDLSEYYTSIVYNWNY